MDIPMKGEKREGGNTSTTPLFPRLHVNDTKKIGTRAPPRNKMALYDQQLSMSSQKFNTTSPTLQANNGASSTHCVFGAKRSMFSPYNNSSTSIHSNGKQPLHSIGDGISGKFSKTSSLTNSNDNVNIAESSVPFKLQCPSVAPTSTLEAQFRPIIVHKDQAATSVPPPMKSDSLKDLVPVDESCTLDLQTNTAHEIKPYVSMSIIGLEPEEHVRVLSEDGLEVHETSARIDKKLSPVSETRESEVDEADRIKARGHIHDVLKQEKEVCRGDASYDEDQKVSIVNNAYVMASESCHESIITDVGHQTLKVGNGNQIEVKDHKDSVSRSIISSEAVIKMIGLEDFQKARNAIIHQQKVFSIQVFELHRLIRVQKLIAGSGNIQHDKLFEPTSLKSLLPKSIPEAPPWHGKAKNGVATTKVTTDNKKPLPLHHLISPETVKAAAKAEENFRNQTNLPDFPITWPWLAPPAPGNQWLFPVMSPSEGLIYKPYPTQPPLSPPPPPPLPPAGLLGPLYNDNGPPNPTTSREDFMNLTCGVSGTTPPVVSTYFAPYGMHLSNNPYASTTTAAAAAALKPMTNSNSKFGAILHQSSCDVGEANNIDGEKMEIRTNFPRKILSSSDILPLFPTSPTLSLDLEQPSIQSHSNEQKTQVIKVIPHSPQLAGESAARIFKFIQEERSHFCN